MKTAELHIDRGFLLSAVDRRIFGSFAEHMGRLVYGGIYQPDSKFADKDGFRKDVATLVRELDVPIIRYPGGNMVSSYRWEDSVGPKKERPTQLEPAWKNVEDNSFGLAEFMKWSAGVGAAPMMAVNLGTRGAADAKNLLEYCNFPGGTLYSDMRKKHGNKTPFDVKLWCLGNEMDGPWQIGHKSADEYGSLAAQTAKLMKLVDPSIELVACGSAGASLPTFASWDATVLEHCYDLVDYISVHSYFDNRNKTPADTADFLGNAKIFDDQIESVIAACDYVRAKEKKKKRINLSVDEWNVVYRPHGKVPPEDWTKAPHELEDTYCMEDVLLVGDMLLSLINHCDRVKIACQAQLVNVIAPIMTSDTGAWRQTIFYPFAQASKYARGNALSVRVDAPMINSKKHGQYAAVSAAVVENPEDDSLVIFAINRDINDPVELICDLRQYEGYKVEGHSVTNHPDLRAVNTEENPFNVVPKELNSTTLDDGRLRCGLGAHSWNVITLKKAYKKSKRGAK